MSCYICQEIASNTCDICRSKTCDTHYSIHHPKCKIGNNVKISRLWYNHKIRTDLQKR